MKNKLLFVLGFGLIMLLVTVGLTQAQGARLQHTNLPQAPLGTAFTYQGRLIRDGSPVTDTCDFQFSLWDSLSGGTQLGSTQTRTGVAVSDGGFVVLLNEAGQFLLAFYPKYAFFPRAPDRELFP